MEGFILVNKSKKILSIIVSAFLLITIFQSTLVSAANSKTDLDGKVNLSLSEDGKNLYNDLRNAKLDLNTLFVDNEKASFSGTVSYEGNAYEINASGEVGKGYLSGAGLIGKLTDSANNFDIAYFTIEDAATGDRIFVAPNLKNKKVIKIYLIRKNTREIIMFEEDYKKIEHNKKYNVNYNINNVKMAERGADYWFLGLVKPEQNTIVSPSATYDKTDTATHSETSWMADRWITTSIVVKQSTTVTDVHAGQARSYTKLQPTLKTDSNYLAYVDDWAPYSVENIKMKAACGSGDRILEHSWAGQSHKGFSVSASISAGISFGLPGVQFASVDASISPSFSQTVVLGDWEYIPASTNSSGSTVYPKRSDFTYPSGHYLRDNNQYYDYSINVAAINGDAGYRYMDFYWTFDIYERDGWGFYTDFVKSTWNRTQVQYN